MKNNVWVGGNWYEMKYEFRRLKTKAIMKGTYRLSFSSHPSPKNWWEFTEKDK